MGCVCVCSCVWVKVRGYAGGCLCMYHVLERCPVQGWFSPCTLSCWGMPQQPSILNWKWGCCKINQWILLTIRHVQWYCDEKYKCDLITNYPTIIDFIIYLLLFKANIGKKSFTTLNVNKNVVCLMFPKSKRNPLNSC